MASQTSSGMGFLGWLQILFIALKLLGKIAWAWKWVLAPTWIPLAIIGSLLMLVGVVLVVRKLI